MLPLWNVRVFMALTTAKQFRSIWSVTAMAASRPQILLSPDDQAVGLKKQGPHYCGPTLLRTIQTQPAFSFKIQERQRVDRN